MGVCFVPVVYIAIVIAPHMDGGLIGLIGQIDYIDWTHPVWTPDTPKSIFICTIIYLLATILIVSSRKRYHRSGVEHGGADWASEKELKKEFHSEAPQRIVYTQNFAVAFDKKSLFQHKRNLNTVIIGGPGAGKTTGFVYPNILEMTSSYIVLDPSGEVCRNTAKTLQQKGNYKIKVLNPKDPDLSWGYNPFAYIRTDDDVQRVVTAIFKATTPPNSQSQDPFWDEAGKLLLSSLMYLLIYFGAEEEKNFPYIMDLLRAGRIEDSEDDTQQSALDILFAAVEAQYPDHIAVNTYKDATSGAGKTMQSVQITLISRLQKFELPSIKSMMCKDELELDKIAEEPTAIYCVIPDDDTSFNFIISMFYIQLFQVLDHQADMVYHGRLPRFVHVIMDEFANVHTPDDFLGILASCRKRNIGISIILQNLSQLKAKYKDGWENIIGLCDEFLYLGGNESSTHEYISKMLGKETIDTNSYGRRYGLHGDSSANFQIAGRELMTPNEVRELDYKYAIMIIRNAPPLIDLKINVFEYKKAKNTPMGGAKNMEYFIPKRCERLGLNKVESEKPKNKKAEPAENTYKATAYGEDKSYNEIKMSVDGFEYNISDYDVAELVQLYEVDSTELIEFIEECIQKK